MSLAPCRLLRLGCSETPNNVLWILTKMPASTGPRQWMNGYKQYADQKNIWGKGMENALIIGARQEVLAIREPLAGGDLATKSRVSTKQECNPCIFIISDRPDAPLAMSPYDKKLETYDRVLLFSGTCRSMCRKWFCGLPSKT